MSEEENQDDDEYMPCDIEYEECVHEGKVLLKCSICKSMFDESDKLVEHFTSAHLNEESEVLEKQYVCHICSSNFESSDYLEEHISWFHKIGPSVKSGTMVKCSYCGSQFSNEYDLKSHIISDHNSEKLDGGSVSLKGKHQYQSNQEDTNQEVKKPKLSERKCSICSVWFISTYDLKKHVKSVHKGKKLFDCTFCAEKFLKNDDLTSHLLRAHNFNPLECSQCNIEFISKKILAKHMALVHEGKKLFECKLCTQNFLTRSDRTSHLSLVHSYNMSRECPICNIYLESKMHVEKHLLTFHYGRELLECTICKETFTKAQYLETHMCQVHKKSKYECLICRECFLKVDQLREHSASVHEGRKFPCSDCKWTFKERKTLRRHIGRAHEKKLCIKSEDSSNNVLESKLGVPKTKDIWNMTFFKNLALKSPRAFRCHKSDWANFCKLSYHDHQNPPTEETYIDFIKKIKGSWAADKTIYNIYLRLRKIALHVYGQELQKFDNLNEIFYDEYMKPKHKKGSLM